MGISKTLEEIKKTQFLFISKLMLYQWKLGIHRKIKAINKIFDAASTLELCGKDRPSKERGGLIPFLLPKALCCSEPKMAPSRPKSGGHTAPIMPL